MNGLGIPLSDAGADLWIWVVQGVFDPRRMVRGIYYLFKTPAKVGLGLLDRLLLGDLRRKLDHSLDIRVGWAFRKRLAKCLSYLGRSTVVANTFDLQPVLVASNLLPRPLWRLHNMSTSIQGSQLILVGLPL